MALSETQICNDGLIDIGQGQISALTDSNATARLCARLYPLRRDALLREYDWNFARQLAKLPALSTAPLFGYALAYQLPADCIAVRGTDQDGCDPNLFAWELNGRTIVTDLTAPLSVIYTRQETNVGLMDSLFTAALSKRIARDAAMPLAQSVALKNQMHQEYLEAISKARGASFREINRAEEETSWLRARR